MINFFVINANKSVLVIYYVVYFDNEFYDDTDP